MEENEGCQECLENARLLGKSGSREMAFISAIWHICKAWAIYKKYQSDKDEISLDEAIIQAERLTRK